MNRGLIALVLVSSFSAPALALERTPARADHRHVESTYKHHRKTGEALSSSFDRYYWEPCNSTPRDYVVNGCDGD